MKNTLLINRCRKQAVTWVALPTVIVAGWIYPPAGFLLLLCMLGAVGLSFFSGRSWCDWMCPRGAFYDIFFQKPGKGKPVPTWFRSPKLRYFMLGFIFVVLGSQLYFSWGDLDGMGMSFVLVLTMTTLVGIVTAFLVHPRSWCHICPMGTLASLFGKGKKPLYISDKCTSCNLCTQACPMGLTPHQGKEKGFLTDPDCIKCGSCTVTCNRHALHFTQGVPKADHQEKIKTRFT